MDTAHSLDQSSPSNKSNETCDHNKVLQSACVTSPHTLQIMTNKSCKNCYPYWALSALLNSSPFALLNFSPFALLNYSPFSYFILLTIEYQLWFISVMLCAASRFIWTFAAMFRQISFSFAIVFLLLCTAWNQHTIA